MLPSLTGPVTVVVRPVGTDRFGAGTLIHLAIAHDNPGDVDPVQVMFDPVDVGGDTVVTFAALTPNGTQIEVAVSAVADTPLSPLASAARTSARKVTGRGPGNSDGSVLLAIDTSASMRRWFADGSAFAAADIVIGVADAPRREGCVGGVGRRRGDAGSRRRRRRAGRGASSGRTAVVGGCQVVAVAGRSGAHRHLFGFPHICGAAEVSGVWHCPTTGASTPTVHGCRHRGRAMRPAPNCWRIRRCSTGSLRRWCGR
ncbi:hypothetical protein ATO49_05620 [Mycolicibacterium fortuitum subsp. fortuitum DSM 46621 = ATCC 6841 = JCM 6387]|nr:hypothetical protein ATO49_05620 [Mycolicibacterium fortuitum subsp. fortuitum DSM 46621 = ATCC 6841 = JCM 6387]